mmetsp:Transcript_33607/g.81287  ORF Transcript_33607/g.81287 Transcript_33607/m.81287 type:complete len:204 (+) Transcript_33607:1306-1917(+)
MHFRACSDFQEIKQLRHCASVNGQCQRCNPSNQEHNLGPLFGRNIWIQVHQDGQCHAHRAPESSPPEDHKFTKSTAKSSHPQNWEAQQQHKKSDGHHRSIQQDQPQKIDHSDVFRSEHDVAKNHPSQQEDEHGGTMLEHSPHVLHGLVVDNFGAAHHLHHHSAENHGKHTGDAQTTLSHDEHQVGDADSEGNLDSCEILVVVI